ncbi:hypothetical protein V565_107280 [Rhizoctonia solani 123E]|uniref:Uncharacterized protein n=1 Tax=Rhizoctonia solani 123E TaxID=1423351 RepID=A0A074RUX4_9AGAM|nr:hypothetical protein V565_107280 [Rhizoctonia solani 123E]
MPCLIDQKMLEDVAGQSFAITGQTTAHPYHEVRRMFQFYSRNGLRFRELPELSVYILSHALEMFLLARYFVLSITSKFTGAQASLVPRWATKSGVLFLQPGT